jgi:hypothetical protein
VRRRWVLPALLLLAGGLGLGWHRAWRWARRPVLPHRFQVHVEATPELSAAGLEILVADLLETQGGWILVPPTSGPPPHGTLVLNLNAHLHQDRLLMDGSAGGWDLPHLDDTPAKALGSLCGELGVPKPGEDLVPADPAAFAELVALMGPPGPGPSPLGRAETLVARLPGCASARLALSRYNTSSGLAFEARQASEQNLRDALLACPRHPRAASALAYFLTNTGRQREALEVALEVQKDHPDSPSLLSAIAYAARTSGLLDLADKALDIAATATGLPRVQAELADNTRLYRGDLAGFEKGLAAIRVDALRTFYQGYARLLSGDRPGALAAFRSDNPVLQSPSLFHQLSAAYRLALEGHPDESLRALDVIEEQRVQARVADGELTFKVAEAYGFLGEPRRALEVMGKAAVQGFGCTAWYERSPFLEGARGLPGWNHLHQTLLERQQALEARFPASSLDR